MKRTKLSESSWSCLEIHWENDSTQSGIKHSCWIYIMVQMTCENLFLLFVVREKNNCNIDIASAFSIYWKLYFHLNYESAPSTNTRNFFCQGYLYSFIPHHSENFGWNSSHIFQISLLRSWDMNWQAAHTYSCRIYRLANVLGTALVLEQYWLHNFLRSLPALFFCY